MLDLFWVRNVAGCEQPRSQEDMAVLRLQNINAILSLTEFPLEPGLAKGFRVCHVPVADYTAPTIAQLYTCTEFLDDCVIKGQTPVVHCAMGRGRTGTVLAAWLISHGSAAGEALDEIRQARPGAVETAFQESVLHDFETDVRRPQTRHPSSRD